MGDPLSKDNKIWCSIIYCLFAMAVGFGTITLSSNAHAAIYYVDSRDGNDSNNGTSPQTAWRTLFRVNRASFSPGDQILLRRDRIWREQLVIPSGGTSSNPILIGAYGSGNRPLISGSVSKSQSSDWRQEGALWHTNVGTEPQIVWKNDERLTRVNAKNLINSPSQWWWDAGNSRVYLYGTSNPTNGGAEFEIAQRITCLQARDISHIVIEGIALKYTNNSAIIINVSSGNARNWTIRNCDIGYSFNNGIITHGASNLGQFDHLTVTDCIIKDFGGNPGLNTSGIRLQYGDYYSIGRNEIVLSDFPGVAGQHRGITLEHGRRTSDTGNRVFENRFSGTSSQSMSCAIGVWNSGYVRIHDNILTSDAFSGILLDQTGSTTGDGPTRCSIYNNLIENKGSNTQFGIIMNNSPNNRIYYNVINASAAIRYNKGIWIRSTVGSGSHSTEIYNNTIVVPGASNCLQIGWRSDAIPTTNSKVMNNIFVKGSGANPAVFVDSNDPSLQHGHVFNNNLYNNPSGPIMNWFGTSHSSLTSFRATGQESAGKQGDPLFVNASANDFRLQSGSSAIDAGAFVGLTSDFEGNPINGLPDMGAFETRSLAGAMTGIIRDASNNTALSGVSIVLSPGNYSAQTDASGRYTITNIPAGTYTLTATLQGYNSRTITGNSITAGGTLTLDFTMTRVSNTITGRVTNSSNSNPISGASVVITPGNYTRTTDSNGNYVVGGIPDGTYTVSASMTGFNTRSISGITVSGGTTRTVNISLTPVTNTITGRVTNSLNSNPISGASVVITPVNYTRTTDSNGNYVVGGIPDGTYTVTASMTGFDTRSITGITVSGGTTRTVNISLTPSSTGGTIYWRSTFETGNVSEWIGDGGGNHTGDGYVTTERPRRGRYSWKAYNGPNSQQVDSKLLRWRFDYQQAYYSAWFYWPTDYTVTGVSGQYVNIFQWKERVSPWNPTWIIAVTNGSSGQDEISVHDWYGKRIHRNRIILPKGRWFHLEASMRIGHGNGHLTVWLDGVQIYSFNNINLSGGSYNTHLMWGVGNYGGAARGRHLYVDDCAVSSYRLGPNASFKIAGDEEIELFEDVNSPLEFSIEQNFPNPFNPSTTIGYAIPEMANVELKIYNLVGQEVKTLISEIQSPGRYSVVWDGTDDFNLPVTSGIYFYRIRTANFIESRKMLFVK